MKEKIYAKTMNPEFFNYRVYDISDDDGNEVIIDGGRDYSDIDSKGELDAIKKAINAINDYDLEVYYNNSKKEYIKYGLLTERKDNDKDYSPKEVQVLWDALWEGGEDNIATILSIIHCKRYEHTGLRGCSQGDYVEAYYPVKTTSKEYLDWIEAWYFGTGTEVMIHDCDSEPENPEDIDGYTFLTTAWNTEGIKEAIRKYLGLKKDTEIVLWEFDGYSRNECYKIAD